MKTKSLVYISMFVACCTILNAGESTVKKYKLPSGKVLINPYVISHTPYALEVGHKDGVMRIPLKDLSPEIQEKYNYSPKKANAFQQKKKKAEALRNKKALAEAKKKKAKSEKFRKMRLSSTIESLGIEVKKTELRIEELKRDLPKLEDEKKNLLDSSSTLAATPVSDNGGSRSTYAWDGGFFYSNGGNSPGNKAERTKRKQISKLDDEYATISRRIRSYKKELRKKEVELMQLKTRLENLKKAKAKEDSK
jgi:hypothetical protein